MAPQLLGTFIRTVRTGSCTTAIRESEALTGRFSPLEIHWKRESFRVAAFIDAGYVWAGLPDVSSRISNNRRLFPDFQYVFNEIRNAILRRYRAAEIAILWYDAPHPLTDIDVLAAEDAGAHVRLGLLSSEQRQKCVDTLLTLDLATCAFEKTIDCAVLYTGDLDFLPAMELCKQRMLPVSLLVDHRASNLSAQLLKGAQGVISISLFPEKFLPEIASKSRRALAAKLVARDCFKKLVSNYKKQPVEDIKALDAEISVMLYSLLSQAIRGKLSTADKIAVATEFRYLCTEQNEESPQEYELKHKFANRFSLETLAPMPIKPPSEICDNLSGRRFGMLTVIGESARYHSRWVVKCSCGIYALRRAKELVESKANVDSCSKCKLRINLAIDILTNENGYRPTIDELLLHLISQTN